MTNMIGAIILILASVSTQMHCVNDKNVIKNAEDRWFEQTLDHFSVQDERTFLQRYIEIGEFFKPGGPLLLEIGAETDLTRNNVEHLQSYILSKQLGGWFFFLEHRYYGKSSPFKNLTAKNLVYLTVEQALEDVAYFLHGMKEESQDLRNAKVGVFGCSYSGSLATWFRYKFPHLVDGAWASSAPLRAVAKFHEYLEVASEVYSNVSWECFGRLRDGYDEMKSLLSTPDGRSIVKRALENWSCGNASTMSSGTILSNVRFVVATHDIPTDHGNTSCSILQGVTHSPFDALILLLKVKSSDVCEEENEEFPNNDIAWSYQTCTEFGFSITLNSIKQPFHDMFDVLAEDLESCAKFGNNFDLEMLQKGINRINRSYAGEDIRVTRVLTVHGALDPWHKLGMREEGNDSPVLLVPGAAHCSDQIYQYSEPNELIAAKRRGREIMKKWLQ
ncbi:hypothetical protein FQA39_LY16644 [Lamprigera yunnana]|nr:hypothetical protein FQA39_LY16644 [Lamprigera yunnana]